MIEKRVTVILYGSDRHLWSGGPLEIRVSDLFAAGGPKELSSGKPMRRPWSCVCSCRSMPASSTGSRSPRRVTGPRGRCSGGLISSGPASRSRETTLS